VRRRRPLRLRGDREGSPGRAQRLAAALSQRRPAALDPAPVPELTATELFAGLPVGDISAARDWYERLLGAEPDFLPHDEEAVWRVAGGWLYVVVDPDRVGRGLVTILVDDLDAHLAELAERGIETGEVEELGNGTRTTKVSDPDGNRIQFGQPPG
jgi:catechol 2,3-dioxygenase-like lactoylglutathione lyase family enzyme